MPETVDSRKPYIYVFPILYVYVNVVCLSLEISYCIVLALLHVMM